VLSIKESLLEQGFLIPENIVNDCHDLLFSSICACAPWFDMFPIRKTIAQTFHNCYSQNDSRAIACVQNHLNVTLIQEQRCVNDWKSYIINLSMPYANGHIEGKYFEMQWLSEILDSNIHIWNAYTINISLQFHSSNTSSKTLYLM